MIISWDQYFMGIAHLSSFRSKDPSTQVGACIVNQNKRIVGIGYNGLPKGCEDDVFPWAREGEFLETKYPYVVHAELNAILNSTVNLENCRIYVSLFPCNECAKAIIQAGITELVYEDDKYHHTKEVQASRKMLEAAGVSCTRLSERVKIEVSIEKNE